MVHSRRPRSRLFPGGLGGFLYLVLGTSDWYSVQQLCCLGRGNLSPHGASAYRFAHGDLRMRRALWLKVQALGWCVFMVQLCLPFSAGAAEVVGPPRSARYCYCKITLVPSGTLLFESKGSGACAVVHLRRQRNREALSHTHRARPSPPSTTVPQWA